MAVRRMSNETALARNGTLSSKAASRVRWTTPVTVRCQPPSLITRAARPPLPMRAAVRSAGHARGGGAPHRAGGAAARASRSPARRPRPRRRPARQLPLRLPSGGDRKSTRLNSSHVEISYAVFCLKKKKNTKNNNFLKKKKKKRKIKEI